MKHSILLTSFLIIVSCSESRQARTIFNRAESYMAAAPDSALTLLSGIDVPSLLTKKLRARHALLLTEAQDKCFLDIVDDSIAQVAYDYYKHHGSDKDRLLATYYLGVVHQNAKEYIDAALSFREAESLAESLEDYRQLSLVEQHLSRIFSLNYDHVRALEHAEKALDAAVKAEEELMGNYCRLDMANQMIKEYRYEEAGQLLLPVLQSTPMNQPLYSLAARSMAHILMFQNQPDPSKAKQYYSIIDDVKAISLNSHDLGVLALISEKEGESEQADFYLQTSKSLLYSAADSALYYNDCRNVYDERKDWKSAHDAKTRSSLVQDRIIIDLFGQSLTHAMGEYYEKNWLIEKEHSRSQLYLLILFAVVLMAGCLVIVLYLRKRNQLILEDMASIQDISSELVDTLVADKINSLKKLSESYFLWEDSAIMRREKKSGKLTKDELISSFRTQLSELRNDHSFISAIEQSLNIAENGIMEKARQSLDNEKELDYSILALLFSGFSVKSIGYLLRMSEASIRMRKSRFKKQFEAMFEPYRSIFLEKLG